METRISSAAKEVIMGQGRPTVLIGDAAKVRPLILAADVIVGQDKVIRPYIDAYRQRQKVQGGDSDVKKG